MVRNAAGFRRLEYGLSNSSSTTVGVIVGVTNLAPVDDYLLSVKTEAPLGLAAPKRSRVVSDPITEGGLA